jgi:GNAT superfamily N-acetyltransferase
MARTVSASLLSFPLEGQRIRLEASSDEVSNATITRIADGAALGTVGVERRQPATLLIESLCIDSSHRGYGAGSEAARLLIEAARAAGYDRIEAWAPPNLGLAVYFWFRMGFRPLHGEGPDGGLAFECELG